MLIKRQEGYLLENIKDTAYLLPYGQKVADQKKAVTLNETAVVLWNLLESPRTKEELVQELMKIYCSSDDASISCDELKSDVNYFIKELTMLGILKESCFVQPANAPTGYLHIANMNIALYCDSKLISEEFGSFYTKEALSHLQGIDQTIEISALPPTARPNGEILIRNPELIISSSSECFLVMFPSMKSIREAHMSPDGRYVKIYVRGIDENASLELFLAMRLFILFIAQKKGFFAIHSASLKYKDKAWLFSGHSGMGKSTHTSLWKELFDTPILNGDLNLIGKAEDGSLKVYGIPWCGTSKIAQNSSWSLGGIVLLGRSETDHFEDLDEKEKIIRIMQRMISPVWTQNMLQMNLDCAKKIASDVFVYHLLCTKNPSAARFMKQKIDDDLKGVRP